MLEESVVYQDILPKGKRQGVQQGESKFALLVLEERFGKLAPKLRKQIECVYLPIQRSFLFRYIARKESV